MKDNQYSIERLSQENLHHLTILYRLVNKKHISVEELQKKYNTKGFGAENIGYLAFTKGKQPAAFYGVIPCLIQLNQKLLLSAQSADTMTHPNHRKQGLFMLLAQKTYELARENKIKFIFGFPNQNSLRGFIKLNWYFAPEKLQCFSIKSSWFPYAKLILRSTFLSKIYYAIVQRLLSDKSVRDNIFNDSSYNGIKHDKEFINYKKYSKTIFLRVDGAYLWIKIDGLLRVGYIKFNRDLDIVYLVKRMKKIANRLGCGEVLFITYKNSQLYNALTSILQPFDSLPVGFFNLSNTSFEFDKLGFEYCDVDIF